MTLEYGIARVEFLAVRPDVSALLAQGWPRSRIYRRLLEEGKISMRYKTFCKHIRETFPLENAAPNQKRQVVQREERPRPSTGTGPQIVGGRIGKTFQKDIVPDEELF